MVLATLERRRKKLIKLEIHFAKNWPNILRGLKQILSSYFKKVYKKTLIKQGLLSTRFKLKAKLSTIRPVLNVNTRKLPKLTCQLLHLQ